MPAEPIFDAISTAPGSDLTAGSIPSVALASGTESPATSRLTCHICGATTSRRGRLFENRADLLRHLRSSHRDVPLGPKGEFAIQPPQPLQPLPATKSTAQPSRPRPAVPREKPLEPHVHAKFCPNCGCNLSVINAALSFAAEHESM